MTFFRSAFWLSPIPLLPVVLVAAILNPGCNYFDSLNDEGLSNDSNLLLQDARAALIRGDHEAARTYLERAHELNESDPEIRVELSAAHFRATDIDVLLIREMVDYLRGAESPTGDAPTASSVVRPSEDYPACNFSGPAVLFDISASAAFPPLDARRKTIASVAALLNATDLSDPDLDRQVRARGLLLRAVAGIVQGIINVQDEIDAFRVELYRLADESIGACAIDEQELAAFEQQLRCSRVPSITDQTEDLEDRLALLDAQPGSVGEQVVQVLEEAADLLTQQVETVCPASS